MAGKSRQSWEKRQREQAKLDKRAQKMERKEERRSSDESLAQATEAQLYERFAELSRRHAEGELTDEQFEAQRAEVFEALGLDLP